MTWWGWAILGACVAGTLYTFRLVFRAMALDVCGSYESMDGMDFFACAFFGGIISVCAWPLILIFAAIKRCYGGDLATMSAAIGGETRGEKQRRRELELRDRERHIADLERELGIK
jgi:hypothetical protein